MIKNSAWDCMRLAGRCEQVSDRASGIVASAFGLSLREGRLVEQQAHIGASAQPRFGCLGSLLPRLAPVAAAMPGPPGHVAKNARPKAPPVPTAKVAVSLSKWVGLVLTCVCLICEVCLPGGNAGRWNSPSCSSFG